MVLTEGLCVFLLYMPLDDICSTYTQILASSKTYRHMYRLLWPRDIEYLQVELTLTQDPRSILAETDLLTLMTQWIL